MTVRIEHHGGTVTEDDLERCLRVAAVQEEIVTGLERAVSAYCHRLRTAHAVLSSGTWNEEEWDATKQGEKT